MLRCSTSVENWNRKSITFKLTWAYMKALLEAMLIIFGLHKFMQRIFLTCIECWNELSMCANKNHCLIHTLCVLYQLAPNLPLKQQTASYSLDFRFPIFNLSSHNWSCPTAPYHARGPLSFYMKEASYMLVLIKLTWLGNSVHNLTTLLPIDAL